jgi:hypothetical protein
MELTIDQILFKCRQAIETQDCHIALQVCKYMMDISEKSKQEKDFKISIVQTKNGVRKILI